MEKLLQIKIEDKVIGVLDRKCEEYGISRRALLELFILKGEIGVSIKPGNITQMKPMLDRNILGGDPYGEKIKEVISEKMAKKLVTGMREAYGEDDFGSTARRYVRSYYMDHPEDKVKEGQILREIEELIKDPSLIKLYK